MLREIRREYCPRMSSPQPFLATISYFRLIDKTALARQFSMSVAGSEQCRSVGGPMTPGSWPEAPRQLTGGSIIRPLTARQQKKNQIQAVLKITPHRVIGPHTDECPATLRSSRAGPAPVP